MNYAKAAAVAIVKSAQKNTFNVIKVEIDKLVKVFEAAKKWGWDFYKSHATIIIDNSGTIEDVEEQVEKHFNYM